MPAMRVARAAAWSRIFVRPPGEGALGNADDEAQQPREGDPGPGEDVGTVTIIGLARSRATRASRRLHLPPVHGW
ncbi:MAG: hypothetical protein IPO00_11440 [Betaproteobacteria bacterium]|nr:hypothetical protein [Betaproteobacteria bacterium]